MWQYSISTGEMTDGEQTFTGYSGRGEYKNIPADDGVRDSGPVPVGLWYIGTPIDDIRLGPCVMRLTPDAKTDTFGRSGFYIHGDSIKNPGNGSSGCIVLPRNAREAIARSVDKSLMVTP